MKPDCHHRTPSPGWGALALVLCLAWPCLLAGAEPSKDQDRAESIRKLCRKLGLGEGRTIADIGCGSGSDTLTFASVVGPGGTVFAEEIVTGELQKTLEKSAGQHFSQVVPVLGQTEDPRLPKGAVDMAYMHFVFHHFARPQEMLRHLWLDVKPGGFLVVIDREKGPLKKWVDTETREKNHAWAGETTVVRLAREAGFLFVDALDDLWCEKEPFVLAFRKPGREAKALGDPDLPRPLQPKPLARMLSLPPDASQAVAFFGLDQGREVLPVLRHALPQTTAIHDFVIDEWATSTNEVPTQPAGIQTRIVRTVEGDFQASADMVFDAVIFADCYHRLWNPDKLLQHLRRTMRPDGLVTIMDRKGPPNEARRLAGHRRRIAPDLVVQEMNRAGFQLVKKARAPAADRFVLVFQPGSR